MFEQVIALGENQVASSKSASIQESKALKQIAQEIEARLAQEPSLVCSRFLAEQRCGTYRIETDA